MSNKYSRFQNWPEIKLSCEPAGFKVRLVDEKEVNESEALFDTDWTTFTMLYKVYLNDKDEIIGIETIDEQ